VERLQGVKVEHGDFRATMKKHDSPDTLVYLDPPYHGTKNDYGQGLDNVTPEQVKEAALATTAKVVISYNDDPTIRKVFCQDPSKFSCHEIEQIVLATSKGAMGTRKDLIIIKH
jgi:site-specific DNA-adenine methylase